MEDVPVGDGKTAAPSEGEEEEVEADTASTLTIV